MIEIQVEDKQWHSLLADRLPEQLDDEIKGVLGAWHEAAGRVSPEEMLDKVPLTLPRCGLPTPVVGVAKFDFETWKQRGQPTLTKAGWIALCELIASKDQLNLQHIITLCDTLRKQMPDSLSEKHFPRL